MFISLCDNFDQMFHSIGALYRVKKRIICLFMIEKIE